MLRKLRVLNFVYEKLAVFRRQSLISAFFEENGG